MSKLMTTRTFSGTFPSPETPPSGEDGSGIGLPKGWSSERVPRSSYRSRRHVASAALMPFSSGRTLPSKWEDAERWICSPVSLGNASTHSNSNNYSYYGTVGSAGPKVPTHLAHHQRRAKSKSGPLGPVGPGYYTSGYNNFSPVLGVGVINEEKWRNTLVSESPGLASARFDERLSTHGGGGGESEGGRRSCPGHDTAHWLDSSWSGPPSPTQGEMNFSDENNEAANNEEEKCKNAGVERDVSRRDMATQMYTESENESISPSPKSSSVSATSPHPHLLKEPESKPKPKPKPRPEPKKEVESSEYEVRDVQVDKQQAASSTKSRPHDHNNNIREDDDSSIISTTRIGTDNQFSNDSKSHREEARIIAWENLQKAKAESAIQKLEEKLEKKRESSMGKIIQKLRKAESKARRMRNSISSGGDNTEGRSISKRVSKNPNSFYKRIRLFSLSRNCATCYPF